MAIRATAADFVVSTNRTMDNDYSSVTGLANGGFSVAWEWGAGTVRDIHYQNFSATGRRVGTLGVIDSATDETPAIAQLSNGSLAVLWYRTETLASEDAGIFGKIVSPDGSQGSAFQINVRTGNIQDRPEIFARPGGTFVATWTSGDADIGDIRGRIFSANGTSSRPEILVNPTPYTQVEQSATQLTNGSFVVTWFSYTDPLDFSGELRGRIFNANGAPTTVQFKINDGSAATRDIEVAGLANGGFVTIYSGSDYLTARTFEADGSPASGEMRVAKFPGLSSEMGIAKLADGTFVAVWASPDNGDGSGSCIRARQLDIYGRPSGTEIIVNSSHTGDQLEPDVAALKGGGFVVTWSDFDETNGELAIVRARVFDVDKFRAATNGSDKFVGTGGADTYDGLGGNDSIQGGAGNDTLYGGSGNDAIDGGKGADKMTGGKGDDRFAVDSVKDKVFEGKNDGVDSITSSVSYSLAGLYVESLLLSGKSDLNATGNTLSNVLTGNSGKNKVAGAAGNDVLKGGAGNDRLAGGLGADKLYGGDGKTGLGNDTFVFTALSDSTVSTKGQDTIYDFASGDRFDLSAIDANGKAKGSGTFSFIGTDKFHGKAGELRYDKLKSDTTVYADTNGDKKADFAFHLDDPLKLVKGDFML